MKQNKGLMVVAIMLIACCLRSPVTGVGPLASAIRAELSLSGAAAGLLTTLPLLAFALVSLFTGRLSARLGAGRTMLWALVAVCAGVLCRSWLGLPGLFAGTVVMGLGIGVNNILLPAVIKSEFPERVGPMTSAYSTLMAGFASLSGAISVPIALAFGWRAALCVWLIAAALALLAWYPSRGLRLERAPEKKQGRSILKSPMTWWISLFMGLQSLPFYCFVAWFATILQGKGYAPETAGYYNSLMMLCGLPGALIMPMIAVRTKHQSLWGALMGLLYAAGAAGAIFSETAAGLALSIVCTGFGSGACIAFCIALFVLHTRDAEDASSLSALAQGIGYLMAAVGPICMGWLFDVTGSWTPPLLALTAVGVLTMVFGWLSGQDKIINADSETP